MNVRVGLLKNLSSGKLMLLNCVIWEDSKIPWTARRLNSRKSVPNIHWKDSCWRWNSKTLATWCEGLTHWKRPWCWERLKAGGEGDNREWDGWMATRTWWAWVWVGSGSWWWIGETGVQQYNSSQRVQYDWMTELNQKRPNKHL